MSYTFPADVDERPVVIVGAGTLGRRIAAVFIAGGTDVVVFDVSAEQRESAREYVAEHLSEFENMTNEVPSRMGELELADSLEAAIREGWMIVEAVTEKVEVKREVFGELDRLASPDAILASNSSSLPSSQFISKVDHPERVLNTHYQRPAEQNAVELMSCGMTDESLIDALMQRLPRYGLVPFHVLRESDGFIMNRIWAAIKRESLMVVKEGVTTPEVVDQMWEMFTSLREGPFRRMDRVGLDVVLDIEEHYAAIREGIPDAPRALLREYVAQGRLGAKTGRGFYEETSS